MDRFLVLLPLLRSQAQMDPPRGRQETLRCRVPAAAWLWLRSMAAAGPGVHNCNRHLLKAASLMGVWMLGHDVDETQQPV